MNNKKSTLDPIYNLWSIMILISKVSRVLDDIEKREVMTYEDD